MKSIHKLSVMEGRASSVVQETAVQTGLSLVGITSYWRVDVLYTRFRETTFTLILDGRLETPLVLIKGRKL